MLGTAQFGLRYGVANAGGQLSREDGAAVLAAAWEAGIRALDTAVLYGESESCLGQLGITRWQVITKLPEMPAAADPAVWVRAQVDSCLERLGTGTLHGLLLHRPAQLLAVEGQALYQALLAVRDTGRVRKIGVSVYGPSELDMLPSAMAFDIVQAPWNVLDQRMTRSGWAQRLHERGCEFHARSVFLQGLLLMPPAARPAHFSRWSDLFSAWDRWLQRTGTTALEACLQHALHTPGIDRIVVGVDGASHLAEIVRAAAHLQSPAPLPVEFATTDEALLNPARWNSA